MSSKTKSDTIQDTNEDENKCNEKGSTPSDLNQDKRRVTRNAIILAIIASWAVLLWKLIPICSKVTSYTTIGRKLLLNTSMVLFFALLASGTILLVEMLLYIWYEICRHNIADDEFAGYDKKADKVYNWIACSVQEYSIVILLLGIAFFSAIFYEPSRAFFFDNLRAMVQRDSGFEFIIWVVCIVGLFAIVLYDVYKDLKGNKKSGCRFAD